MCEWCKNTVKRIIKFIPYLLIIIFFVMCWQWFDIAISKKQDVYTTIVNGVISGVVTSILILIFSIIWRSNITPWVENLLYKDTKIEGVWNGILVPFIGIEEIDKKRVKFAFAVIRRRKKRRNSPSNEKESETMESSSTSVSASIHSDNGDKDIEAELIFKDKKENSNKDEFEEKRILVGVTAGVIPIEVRAEIKRVGHSIIAQVVEIGGASQIHTYKVRGSFKNLILTGEYENEDSTHIDRGSLSLMLLNNGSSLEGFFSSYADSDHRMAPFKCILKRQSSNPSNEE